LQKKLSQINKINWLDYWNKKNVWTNSSLWKKNSEIFYKKTSRILQYDKKQKVLDIGCGSGDLINKILDQVEQIYCLDTSEEYINICKIKFSTKKNVTVIKLGKNYTDLSFLKNIKFSIIIVNSVLQYYKSQDEVINLIKSIKSIASVNAKLLIADLHVVTNIRKSYLSLILNSIINSYFWPLVKMNFQLMFNKTYSNTEKSQSLLFVDFDKLVKNISSFTKKVNVIHDNITVNVGRKHLLVDL